MDQLLFQSARLVFRPWTPEDLPLAQELWGNPDVARFIHAKGAYSAGEVAARLEREMELFRQHSVQYWPMFMRTTEAFAGCCGLRPYASRPGTLELGVHLLPTFWHQGLAQEACRRVMAHAFDDLNTSALFAGHNPGNAASRKLLTELGFTYIHDEFYPPTGLQHPSYLLENPRTGGTS